MIELQFDLRTAVPTPAAVPHLNELPDVIGNHVASVILPLRRDTHSDHGLGSFDPALLSLLPRNEQRMHLRCIETVVIPIEAILKAPVSPLPDRN